MLKKSILRSFSCTALSFCIALSSGCLSFRSSQQLTVDAVSTDQPVIPAIVLGGGVGGLTAALYFAQAHVPCVVIQGPKPGGALSQSHSVRNWPGVVNAPGQNIVGGIADQVKSLGVELAQEKVVAVDFSVWPRIIKTQSLTDETVTKSYRALAVVIATGTEPNYLGVPGETGEDGYWGKGVSNCAVCEGSLYQDKRVIIVGGGDAAITEADYLADIASEVMIFVRKDFFRAKDIKARDKVLARPNVKVFYNTVVEAIEGDDSRLTDVVAYNTKTQERSTVECDGLFLAIGSQPNTKLFKNHIELDQQGFVVRHNAQESSIPGIYAVGDVTDHEFVQAITAAGDGCKAALAGIKFLKDAGYVVQTNTLQNDDDEEEPAQAEERVSKNGDDDALPVKEVKTADDFDRLVLKSERPVVIDLYSTWCIPCQTMAPIVEELAQEFTGAVDFVSCNIGSKDIRTAGIDGLLAKISGQPLDSVPTFIFVNKGKQRSRIVGVVSKQQFIQTINKTFGIS